MDNEAAQQREFQAMRAQETMVSMSDQPPPLGSDVTQAADYLDIPSRDREGRRWAISPGTNGVAAARRVMASPRPTRYVLRSQAMSPCRGSGP